MFYWLTEFAGTIPGINVFRYITFRTGGAMVTGALFVFMFGPWIIDHLRLAQGKGQPIRADGPPTHLVTKKGTPTMGGLMILSGLAGLDAAVGQSAQPVCLDRAAGHARLRLRRLLRRLSEGHEADPSRLLRAHASGCRRRDRADRMLSASSGSARDPSVDGVVIPFIKDFDVQPRLVLR